MNTKLIFTFIVLLFLGSCTGTQVVENYRSGTEGVELSFLRDSLELHDQDYLNLQLVLRNRGAFDDPQGKIILSGYDPTVVKISNEEILLPDDFPGKNLYDDEGSMFILPVKEEGPITLSLGESYSFPLQAHMCYGYQTIATPTACLLYRPEDDYICRQDPIGLGSQGGPVMVQQVDQHYMQDHVRFTVTIAHVGDGTVVNAYDNDAYNRCPFGLTRNDLNHVGVSMEIAGLSAPTCTPANQYVALNDQGIGVITCTFTLREQRSFVTPLRITLDYLYMDAIGQQVSVSERAAVAEQEAGGLGPAPPPAVESGARECYCSDANMRIWGGCICLYIDGKMHYCLEGSNTIPVSASAGEVITYEVHGSPTVNKCGDSVHPTGDCPFTGSVTVPKKHAIYGTTADGRTVSERCELTVR